MIPGAELNKETTDTGDKTKISKETKCYKRKLPALTRLKTSELY